MARRVRAERRHISGAYAPTATTSPRPPDRSGRAAKHRSRRTVAIAASVIAAVAAVLTDGAAVAARSCWAPPVEASVSDPFRRPSCRWCAGNRGIEFATSAGQPVRAVAAGRVTFAGAVAGTGYLVVEHADGRRATYGNISGTTVDVGDPVLTGMRLGVTAGAFHFGLRDGDDYVDPTPLLGRWVSRARLIPIDGSRPRPAPPPELVCGSLPPRAVRR